MEILDQIKSLKELQEMGQLAKKSSMNRSVEFSTITLMEVD